MKKKIVIITQARLSSSRFPQKILAAVDGEDTLLSLHIKRLKRSQLADEIVVATTHESGIESVVALATSLGVKVYQGSTDDVLDRFYQAAKMVDAETIVRVTSDCPLIDANLIDEVISFYQKENIDYTSNTLKEEFPVFYKDFFTALKSLRIEH